jgi:hypothetical protein
MIEDPRMKYAREALIAQREEEGRPFSMIVQAGIRSGQWDRGELVRQHLRNNYETPLQGE